MISRDLEFEVRALSYLTTIVIYRLHQTGEAWWREFLRDITADMGKSPPGSAEREVLQKAIAIVERH
jgi:N-glycosylase/DNA lyase